MDPTKRYLRELKLLEQLSRARHPQTLSQLAQRLDLPKTSLMRILATLVESGYVVRAPGEQGYVPGPAANGLALSLLGAPNVLRAARAILARLVEATGESCNLTALEGDRMRYIQRVETQHPLRLSMDVGDLVPLHCTATGKLMLALMDVLTREQTLGRLVLTPYTGRTLVDRQMLERDLEKIRCERIGTDREEFVLGMVAVAVPVVNTQGRMIAALASHGPTARVSMRFLLDQVPKMRQAANDMGLLFVDEKTAD